MARLQIFYDYECPYCKKGYGYLLECIGDHPEITIEWRPVEAHPRPEDHPPHTDLCVQSYYIAVELGADMPAFHKAMYQGVAAERRNVEKPEVLEEILKGIVDSSKYRALLDSGKYAAQVDENNDLAYEKSGVWAVPSYRLFDEGKPVEKLDAVQGVGVTLEQLRELLQNRG